MGMKRGVLYKYNYSGTEVATYGYEIALINYSCVLYQFT